MNIPTTVIGSLLIYVMVGATFSGFARSGPWTTQAPSPVAVTGAALWSTDASGFSTGDFWNTHNDGWADLRFVNPAGGYFNDPVLIGVTDDSALNSGDINIPLSFGINDLQFYAVNNHFHPDTYEALSLFFDGNRIQPGISAFVQMGGSSMPMLPADNSPRLVPTGYPLGTQPSPGLSSSNGLVSVELVAFSFRRLTDVERETTGYFYYGSATLKVTPIGPPTSKEQCKDNGWQAFDTPRRFKNQGDCIQFVNTGK